MCSQRLEHITAHARPLLARHLQRTACSIDQLIASKIAVIVIGIHDSGNRRYCSQAQIGGNAVAANPV